MKTSKYEDTYVATYKAKLAVEHVDEVVDFLRKQGEPVSCKTIGEAVYGEARYNSTYYHQSCASTLGQILKHLRKGGFVNYIEVEGAPIKVLVWGYHPNPEATLEVFDREGNRYLIPNPNIKNCPPQVYGEYEKTIIPKTKLWSWVK